MKQKTTQSEFLPREQQYKQGYTKTHSLHFNEKPRRREGDFSLGNTEKKRERRQLVHSNFEQHGTGMQVRRIDTILFRVFLISLIIIIKYACVGRNGGIEWRGDSLLFIC